MPRLIAISALPAALFLCSQASAEGFVTGRVTDTEEAPVAGASIRFIDEDNPQDAFGDTTAGDGSYSVLLSLPTSIETGAVPGGFQLFPNYPNPFNSSTLIPYSLAEPGHIELTVYNLLGQRVRTLEDSHLPAGGHAAAWDGRGDNGNWVSAGVYLYRLQLEGQAAAGKMTLIDGASGRASRARGGKSAEVTGPAQDRRYTVHIRGIDIEEYWQFDTAIPEGGVLDFTVVRLEDPASPATTPEQLMENLSRAMNGRNEALYESLLDEDFWFSESDCLGNLVFANGREEELEILTGTRDGGRQGMFDFFRTIWFEFQLIERSVELGGDYPGAFEGDPDGHPDEDWEAFRGRVEILLLRSDDDGFRVDQIMTFKLREGDDGIWRLVRWIADPLVGDCGAGKVLEKDSWGRIKATFIP